MTKKPKVMLHLIMKNQLGGPNICMYRLRESQLDEKYDFSYLDQDKVAGGKISFSLIKDLCKKIKAIKPDIIHLSGMQSAGFHSVVAAKLSKVPKIIINVHGFSVNAIHLSKIKRFVFGRIIEPLTLYLSDVIIVNSYFTATHPIIQRHMKKHSDKRIEVIYNLPPEKYEGSFSIRRELNLSKDDILISTVSRIVYDKGYENLAKTITQLSKYRNVKFIIVGDGEYRQEFESQVSKYIGASVFLLGKRNDIQQILNDCDIFVLPSFHETLSNVTIEASIQGLPCIVSNVGGLKEIVEDGKNGYLVDPFNNEELIEKTERLILDKVKRLDMGLQAEKIARNKFSAATLLDQFSFLYDDILEEEKNVSKNK